MNYYYAKSLLCCIFFLSLSQRYITKKMNTQTSETTPPKSQNPLFRIMVISKQVTGKVVGATTGGLVRFVKSRFNQRNKNDKHKNDNDNTEMYVEKGHDGGVHNAA
jgi:hypothetical protein